MHRIQYWARQKAHGTPLVASTRRTNTGVARTTSRVPSSQPTHGPGGVVSNQIPSGDAAVAGSVIPPTENEKNGDAAAVNGGATKPNVAMRFVLTVTDILFSSYVNILLVFVPVGIAAHFAKLSAGIVFAMNAIAIIPLAGLLSHATESVASRMGDTIGALMNVTFGNAVELIIFIIALVKDEIEIVQASLVGSILANLLLILGMCFLLGGLRYREQIYNSTVTQMSACLLSLSVSSLLLPTAFHASFSSATNADTKVLAVSRGTSVVLLLVYVLYLVFQLNSHAYMYESTPRHIVERESLPGPAASYFNSSSSSSSETSSDSSHGDSDSDASRSTAKRIKRVIKKGRKKMHNRSASTDANSAPTSALPHNDEVASASASGSTTAGGPSDAAEVPPIDNGVVADDEDDEAAEEKPRDKKKREHHKKKKVAETKSDTARAAEGDNDVNAVLASSGMAAMPESGVGAGGSVRRVDFALGPDVEAQTAPRPQPFSLRWLARPAGLTKTLPDNVFHARAGETQASSSRSNAQPLSTPDAFAASNQPRPQPQLRRTASMPVETRSYRNQPGALPPIVPVMVNRRSFMAPAAGDGDEDDEEEEPQISRTTAVLLLLVSTGLVALCAEFMVGSINEVVSGNSGISEAFIGLILLPIVGNAAEHVTGVTVAMKNKMDLALGVALGSSIQIAIFVTPVVVLLGWIMGKDMSLYFTLFETVSMFVSAFIVNFLVLDGRSNYLEGALLCAAYVIIAVASFFYPGKGDANSLGGGTDNVTESVTVEATKMAVRGLVSLM
ncbi:calcium/proton exchanger [Sporothrix schenckii ATCC 58251]|uniref:Calcium/proton exchanger n=1 Tax=Sporothrix schenckii (strain ATCC 58251 / de Perez 2211183) TaxID=1391915 RepID=U7PVN4_SPOS1|nr:calcium/proton exchanger [Sporothrix schenckii ATCC 58251]